MAELNEVKRKIAELEVRGAVNEAIRHSLSAIEEFPNEGSLYNKLGDLYVKTDQLQKALDIYERGIDIFRQETYYPNAIALAKKILRHDSNRTELYGLLGELHKLLDQRGEAANYLLEYADRKRKANDLDTALKTYDMIKELVPNNARILKMISAIHEQVGRVDRGSELREEAKEIETKHERFREIVLEEKGFLPAEEPVEAVASEPPAVEEPAHSDVPVATDTRDEVKEKIRIEDIVSSDVAELLQGEDREARVSAAGPDGLSTLDKTIELGELYLKLGSIEEAIDCFRDAEQESWRQENYARAFTLNKKIADLRPFDLKSRQHLVEIAHMRGDRKLEVTFMLELAEALHRREAKSEAQKVYRDILRIDPDNPVARERAAPAAKAAMIDLGAVLRIEQSEARAETAQTIEELVSEFRREVFESIGEGDYTSHYDLGVAYKGMGLYQEAIEEFEIAARDDGLKMKALEMTGACYLEHGKVGDAIRVLAEGLKIEGHNDREYFGIHFLLGTCYEQNNDLKNALKSYVNAYSIDRKVAALNEKIVKLKERVTDEYNRRRRRASGGQ